MQFPIDDPRGNSRQVLRESLDSKTWSMNEAFTRRLVDTMRAHRLHHHPIVAAWERNEFTLESMVIVHLEVRAAFAEIFTDALIRLMQTTGQLERRLGAKAKMAARFLLELNVLEELGFRLNVTGSKGLCGHPGYSHYWQLTDTLAALGAPEETWASYVPAPESVATRKSLEENYDDHLRLAVVLATIETVFVPYYSPWSQNTLSVCKADIADGYHSIHVEDDTGKSLDEDHGEDSWYVVRQALTPDRYEEIEALTVGVLDLWAGFMDMLMRRHQELKRAAA